MAHVQTFRLERLAEINFAYDIAPWPATDKLSTLDNQRPAVEKPPYEVHCERINKTKADDQ